MTVMSDFVKDGEVWGLFEYEELADGYGGEVSYGHCKLLVPIGGKPAGTIVDSITFDVDLLTIEIYNEDGEVDFVHELTVS